MSSLFQRYSRFGPDSPSRSLTDWAVWPSSSICTASSLNSFVNRRRPDLPPAVVVSGFDFDIGRSLSCRPEQGVELSEKSVARQAMPILRQTLAERQPISERTERKVRFSSKVSHFLLLPRLSSVLLSENAELLKLRRVITEATLPTSSVDCRPASIAQLVEQLTLNQQVQGSSPCGGISKWLVQKDLRQHKRYPM
eukprot:TRINITY_DN34096_c0_g1_i1.p1 TRINITY_DN34096_c0_g1~~TRINITY_DN34096_c0_g1_i1.p1  ORF type:complete len:196 (-),score=2.65 TRINITY_DN34096_c0_g1_i1:158-745(-)